MKAFDHTALCIDCGAEFCRYTSRQRRCGACQKRHLREYKAEYNRRYWKANKDAVNAVKRAMYAARRVSI